MPIVPKSGENPEIVGSTPHKRRLWPFWQTIPLQKPEADCWPTELTWDLGISHTVRSRSTRTGIVFCKSIQPVSDSLYQSAFRGEYRWRHSNYTAPSYGRQGTLLSCRMTVLSRDIATCFIVCDRSRHDRLLSERSGCRLYPKTVPICRWEVCTRQNKTTRCNPLYTLLERGILTVWSALGESCIPGTSCSMWIWFSALQLGFPLNRWLAPSR